MEFHGVSDKSLMDNLMEKYRNTRASDLEACRKNLAEIIEVYLIINTYFQWVNDSIQFPPNGKTPFTLAKIVQIAYHVVNNTGQYSLVLKEWQKKAAPDQTWEIFNKVFAEEYHNLVEETAVTSRDTGFHLSDVMQDIVGALEHLTMVPVVDK